MVIKNLFTQFSKKHIRLDLHARLRDSDGFVAESLKRTIHA
jgi:hypothetical protein